MLSLPEKERQITIKEAVDAEYQVNLDKYDLSLETFAAQKKLVFHRLGLEMVELETFLVDKNQAHLAAQIPSPRTTAENFYLAIMGDDNWSDILKRQFEFVVNTVNENYTNIKSTSFIQDENSLQLVALIRSDSCQEETVEGLTGALLSVLNQEDLASAQGFAVEIAATIYSSFKVLTKAIPSKELDGIAFRDGQLVIIERKTNNGTGPRELQRNFLADKINDKTKFLNLPEMREGTYLLEIKRPNCDTSTDKNLINQLMAKAEQLIRQALGSKCIEFTFNSPAEKDIEYYQQVRYPEGFTITLRLSSHVNGQGKGDENLVKAQLPQTIESLKTKLSDSQRFLFLNSVQVRVEKDEQVIASVSQSLGN